MPSSATVLERLKLVNFQVHRKRLLTLDPKITTIIGPSDRGKSAIVRALRWVLLNEPRGDSFTSFGARQCKVMVLIGGKTIARERGSKNSYRCDGVEYVSFGQSVPAPIARVLNVDEDNFQLQHAAPYWLQLTGSQLSKALNRIIDLSVIDATLDLAAQRVRKQSALCEAIERQLAQAQARVADLRQVPDLVRDWDELWEIRELLENQQARLSRAEEALRHLSQGTAQERGRGRVRQGAEALLEDLSVFAADQDRIDAGLRWVDELDRYVKELKLREEQVQICQTTVEQLKLSCPRCGKTFAIDEMK